MARACAENGHHLRRADARNCCENFGDKTAAKRLAAQDQRPDRARHRARPDRSGGGEGGGEEDRLSAHHQGQLRRRRTRHARGQDRRRTDAASWKKPSAKPAPPSAGAEVFVERYIARAKHIEVQILGDEHGNLVHLWERDCSVQRRHQKVVEIAPSINLPLELREAICDAAVRLCTRRDYRNAGTVEFLLDLDRHEFFFIEVNPRIQVEHTVTEVVTGIDIVKSQILVAQGHKLHEAPLNIPPPGEDRDARVAIQCRITTEDPENHFIPDYGRLTTYRSPGGFAVRLDGGNGFGGAVITPYFDSLLVKVTTWGTTFQREHRPHGPALREFRVRGVKTNIPFLENLIPHPTFASGDATTTFIDNTPELFHFRPRRDRATKILSYLGDVIINGRPDVKGKFDPKRELPEPVVPTFAHGTPPPPGTRNKLLELGPEKFAEWVRKQKRLLFTDTTMRDAHQSLLATRVRTYDLLAVAEAVAHLTPESVQPGDVGRRDVRHGDAVPAGRSRGTGSTSSAAAIPNILFQMLLRASNAVGYTNYPDNVVREFVKESAPRTGSMSSAFSIR